MTLAGTIPADDAVYAFDLKGQPTIEIPDDNPAMQAAFVAFDKMFS